MPIKPLNAQTLPEFRARLAKLQPDAPRRWGKLEPAGMLRHLALVLSIPMKDGGVPFMGNAFTRSWLAKRVVLSPWLRWPRGKIKVPDSATPPAEGGIPEELAALEAAMERFCEAFEADPRGFPEVRHPFFGRLTMAEWSRFHGKHIDHHCKQFGL